MTNTPKNDCPSDELDELRKFREDTLKLLSELDPIIRLHRQLAEAMAETRVNLDDDLWNFRNRLHPFEPEDEHYWDPDFDELAGTCDCSASMPGNSPPHSPGCPSYRPED